MKNLLTFVLAVALLQSVLRGSYTNTAATQGYLTRSPAGTDTAATIVGWVRMTGTGSSDLALIFCGRASADGWGCYCPAGGRLVNILRGGVAVGTGSVSLSSGVWTHIALTRNGSAIELFISGASVLTNSGTVLTPSIFEAIGDTSQTSPALAAVAEMAYFDRILTTDEIKALAQGLRPLKIRQPTFYWPLVGLLKEVMAAGDLSITGAGVSSTEHPRVYN